MKKEPIIFIDHIIQSIEDIESFVNNIPKESFFNNKEKQNAVIRGLEVIGEAVKNISVAFRNKYPLVPWKDVAGMRDKLMHHYFGINLDTVWKVIKEDLPSLKENMLSIKKKVKNENSY